MVRDARYQRSATLKARVPSMNKRRDDPHRLVMSRTLQEYVLLVGTAQCDVRNVLPTQKQIQQERQMLALERRQTLRSAPLQRPIDVAGYRKESRFAPICKYFVARDNLDPFVTS